MNSAEMLWGQPVDMKFLTRGSAGLSLPQLSIWEGEGGGRMKAVDKGI